MAARLALLVAALLVGCASPAPPRQPPAPQTARFGPRFQALLDRAGPGGARPFYAPEADTFPLARIAKEAGITDARLAQPKTLADFDLVEQYRKLAIDGMKAGLQSGQRVPYP